MELVEFIDNPPIINILPNSVVTGGIYVDDTCFHYYLDIDNESYDCEVYSFKKQYIDLLLSQIKKYEKIYGDFFISDDRLPYN